MKLKYLHQPAKVKKGEKAELLILLHGYGSNMKGLFGFASSLPEKYEIVALQGPIELEQGGFAWFDIDFSQLPNLNKINNVEQANDSIEMIEEDIAELCEKFDCDKRQVNLLGFSQGGILSYAISLKKPENYRKILPLSAYAATDVIGTIEKNADYSHLNFFISHGKQDKIIPLQLAQISPLLLDSLNIDYIFEIYDEGHEINAENLADVVEFLKE